MARDALRRGGMRSLRRLRRGPRAARALSTAGAAAGALPSAFAGVLVAARDAAAAEAFGEAAAAFACGHGEPAAEAEALARDGALQCGSAEALWALAALFERKQWRGAREALREPLAALETRLPAGREGAAGHGEDAVCLATAARALGENDPSRAARIFEGRMLVNPYNIIALRSLQEVYMRRGDNDRALACVERTLSEWSEGLPSFPAVLGLHARALFACGFYGEAERLAGQALSGESRQGIASTATAHGFLQSFRFRECVRLTRELEHVYEENLEPASALAGEFYYVQALASLQCGKFRPALQHVDSLMSFESVWPQSWPQATLALWRSLIMGGNDEKVRAHDAAQLSFDLRKLFQSGNEPRRASPTVTDRFQDIQRVPEAVEASPESARLEPFLHLLKVLVALGADDARRAAELRAMTDDATLGAICDAFLLRQEGAFAKAAHLLEQSCPDWASVAPLASDAALLDGAFVECTLRAAGIDTEGLDPLAQTLQEPETEAAGLALRKARALMSQRTVRNPNDPYAWNLFTRVLSAVGNYQLANMADTRSKELGYLQGGGSSF